MNPLEFVKTVAPLVGLELTEEREQAVAEAFAMVVRLGAPALDCKLDGDVQQAPVFHP